MDDLMAIDSLLNGRDAGFDDDVAPFGRFGGDELGELLGRVETPSAPCSMILAVTDGSLMAATSSSLSLAMTEVGVPRGANNASHPDAS